MKKRGLTGVADGTYWKKWGQLPDVQAANRERAKARYYALTPSQRAEVRAKARAARKAKLATNAAFAADQATKQSARHAKWRANHPGLQNARSAAYAKAHPEVKRANKHARRALGKIDPRFIAFLRSQPCLDCGTTAKPRTLGHLIPVKRGGTNHPCNLVAQCRSCNSTQSSRAHPRASIAHYPEAARFAVAA